MKQAYLGIETPAVLPEQVSWRESHSTLTTVSLTVFDPTLRSHSTAFLDATQLCYLYCNRIPECTDAMKVSGNRHRRYPASSAPHRTAKPDNVGFSFGRIERELVRKTPCFLARREERSSRSCSVATEKFTLKSCIRGGTQICSESKGVSKNP